MRIRADDDTFNIGLFDRAAVCARESADRGASDDIDIQQADILQRSTGESEQTDERHGRAIHYKGTYRVKLSVKDAAKLSGVVVVLIVADRIKASRPPNTRIE